MWIDFKGQGLGRASHCRLGFSLHGGSSLFKWGGLGTRDAGRLSESPQVSTQSLVPYLGEREEALQYCTADGAWLPSLLEFPKRAGRKDRGRNGFDSFLC